MATAGDVLRGKYRRLRGIGEGGMGQVFEAEHLRTGARVAIKLLHSDRLDHGTARQRFLREARASARVGHRNIVEVYDLDMDDSGTVPFIVQEILTGRTLAALLDGLPEGWMSPHAALTTLVPLMGALVEAHRRGGGSSRPQACQHLPVRGARRERHSEAH